MIALQDWRTLVQRLERWALDGDLNALKFLVTYLLGRPAPAAQPPDASESPVPPHNRSPELQPEMYQYEDSIENNLEKLTAELSQVR